MVINSVGSPAPVINPLHASGCKIFADVASIKQTQRVIAAGAGGNTGWANSFAFVRAVRSFFADPLVLAGGISDGASLLAARVLGCDLAYMGTRFIATQESMAKPAYEQALVAAGMDDIMLTRAFTGLDSMLRPSIIAVGLDPDRLNETVEASNSGKLFGAAAAGPRR